VGIRRFFKKQFNVKKWIDADNMKRSASMTKDIVRSFMLAHRQRQDVHTGDSFESVIERQGLTEEDLQHQQKTSLNVSYAYFGLGIAMVVYSCFQFYSPHILGGMMTLVLGAVFLTYGLKEYTHYYQIRYRVLKFKIADCLKALFMLQRKK
jgi:Leu/Phe-tRNA-protein transferase